jgi:hypothetical protein
MLKQFGLAAVLIIVPVGIFAAVEVWLVPHPAAEQVAAAGPVLGDLSPMVAIVTDVQGLVAKGDLAGAATRITDLETAWDDAEATMRPMNPEAWGAVDGLIDTALTSLRTGAPQAEAVTAALVALQAGMAAPVADADGAVQMVAGIAVTDAGGHALPCETMIDAVRAKPADKLSPADQAKVTDLQTKATERCNADDDARADAFSAQALAILAQ